MLNPRWTILLFLMLLTFAAGQHLGVLSAPDVTLWLSWPSTPENDRFFDAVQREFAPGGAATFGGHVEPAADAINKMSPCDYTVEATFLNRVLSASGTRPLCHANCSHWLCARACRHKTADRQTVPREAKQSTLGGDCRQ